MTISICIPSYNRPELLKETLLSCMAQTHKPNEIVIGDDSINDLTANIIPPIQERTSIPIRYYHHTPPLKQAANTNFLFQKATGEKLVLIHDDDLLLPEAVETLVGVFKKNPILKIAFGKSYIMSESGVIDYKASDRANSYFYKDERYEGSVLSPMEAGIIQQFPNNGYMIDTELARSVPWRTETSFTKLGHGNEYDFGLRIGMTGQKMFFINKYLVKYRDTIISNSSSSDSAYKSYLLLKNTEVETKYLKIKNVALSRKASYGIVQALKLGEFKDALNIYFSKNHFKLWYTLGFYRRFLMLCQYILKHGYKND